MSISVLPLWRGIPVSSAAELPLTLPKQLSDPLPETTARVWTCASL